MKRSAIKKRPMSDTTLSSLEPEANIYREHDGNSLYLRVKPSGSKVWDFRYKKQDGKWSWMGIGSYPEVSARKARSEAARLKELIHDGIDPVTGTQAKYTFQDAAEDWYQHKLASGRAESATRQMRLYLDKDILPVIGDKQIGAVSRQECVRIQSSIEARGARAIASKVRVWLNQIFSRAIAHGHCELNPASELRQVALPSTEKQYPHLLEADLPDFLKALSESNAQQLALTATWMLLRTATRPGMVRMAEWSEIDLEQGLWTVPAARMKTKVDYQCPLSSQIIDDLKLLHQRTGRSKYLFPGTRNSATMSDGTINKVISSVGYKGRLVGHGSRHTASTLLHEHGWQHEHIEAQLSHTVKGVAGVYNKASYLKQRKEMMQWYSDYLDELNPSI